MICQACENEQHYLCGMQTWCKCECDGSVDWDSNDENSNNDEKCQQ